MGDSAALRQLMDMGIPRGRALAALVKAKNDVATAAERVFSGEHDDIDSDDEGELGVAASAINPSKARTAGGKAVGITTKDSISISSDDGSVEDVELSDDEDAFDGFSDDGLGDEHDVDMEQSRLLSDPYAGVFFSKDRVETIIESVEDEDWAVVPVAGDSTEVRLLMAGEWMNGCPEGNEQSFLFQLYNKLSADDLDCAGSCGHVRKRAKADFFAILPDFQAYLKHLVANIHYECPRCSTLTCLACGDKVDVGKRAGSGNGSNAGGQGTKKEKSGNKAAEEIPALLHCSDLQGVIIGMGLHIIEQAFKDVTGAGSSRASAKRLRESTGSISAKASKKVSVGVFPGAGQTAAGGDGDAESADSDYDDEPHYGAAARTGIKQSKGTGYAGQLREDTSGQRAAAAAEKARDVKTAALLRQVQVYLPQLDRASGASTGDHLVHPTTLAHLRRRSAFVNDLLRNDSLLDMSNRSELYQTLFDWLKVVSNHEALASMLAMPQMRPAKTVPQGDDLVEVTYEGNPSPRELLENIVIQAQAAIKGLQTGVVKDVKLEGFSEEDLNRMTQAEMDRLTKEAEDAQRGAAWNEMQAFCEQILAAARTIDKSLKETKGAEFVKRMQDALPRLPDATGGAAAAEVDKGLSSASKEAVIKIYEKWAGKVRFQYADLLVPGTTKFEHAYQSHIDAISENTFAAKRSLAIAKELAILTTNLPVAWHSTIFLRVDETRVDAIKAMIIGPEGTPYENGCFVFDIFLPLEYNHVCPLVKSMTTNGGKYRYNPNLYAEGKVCLSLLGTWSGPGWISGQSTLLQVLISIQSLIMCEEPYCNEPGWAQDGGSAASKAYSANVRRMVLHDAMGNNIKNPPRVFANEIRTHFRLKAKSIREQIDKWQAIDDGGSTAGEGHYAAHNRPGKTVQNGGGPTLTDFQKKAQDLEKLLDGLESGKIGAK